MITRLSVVAFLLLFAFAPVTFAATNLMGPTVPAQSTNNMGPTAPSPNAGSEVTLINPLGTGTTINSFVLDILEIITDIVGPVVVIFMLVYVGFLFVVARGDPGKLTAARTALLWTLVGALILLGAQVIAVGIYETVQALRVGN
ncbi:hypothetical protein A3G63_03125 [Candidatus Kaiserbacteria bacterium RIFCSPLOWO2_12_FULL_52_8]|uniref:Uncharacterized protein n=1 Tax=Candidatus Kaiserbacteria bacterium RIFCSPHIGHO2_01_FULL_53_31 TaxID=1798481 RepID=A0A1F6CHB2_9BACT|nr:MAG: hypothetical protein A2678_03415 [Candidatus Kaiserbacteria bacterium RIFCSPHIGHO2_01_FULL_53_31]OGG92699.1 MAG: hypothetical protein A3G63_03125 [Candidatus Kaiserbacteria bacterium RIFCSPLOWO2_12_FULL_52_8]